MVSFKGCKLGVDQSIVQDPRSYGEQLIQGIIGIILNLDVGYDMKCWRLYSLSYVFACSNIFCYHYQIIAFCIRVL